MEVTGAAVSQRAEAGHNKSPSLCCPLGERTFQFNLEDTSGKHLRIKVVWEWSVLYILTSKCASRQTACTFSTSQLLKGLRSWGVLYLLTWACALRHNGVHFFMSHLARWLRTRRFSEPTFRPSGDTNHWKNTVFRFSRTCIFFLLTFSLLWSSLFCSSLFYSTLLSDSSHLCFSSVHLSEVWLLNFLRT